MKYEIKKIIPLEYPFKFKCPDCELWTLITEKQFEGKNEIKCNMCGWHEAINLKKEGKLI